MRIRLARCLVLGVGLGHDVATTVPGFVLVYNVFRSIVIVPPKHSTLPCPPITLLHA